MRFSKKWRINGAMRQDLIIAICMVISVYVVSASFDLAERFIAWSEEHEKYNVDELPLVFMAMAFAAAWFSGGRIRELRNEITMRTQAEAKSHENLKMFQTLFEEGLSGNFIANEHGHILLCNEAFRNMSGISNGGQQNFSLAHALGDRWQKLLLDLRNCEYLDFQELVLNLPNNRPLVVMARFRLSLLSQDISHKIHGYFTDITEQYLAEKELAELLVENRALSKHAMEIQEQERCHLAREIHDDMGQYLTAIRLDAATIPRNTENAAVAIHADRIAQHAEHIQAASKRIIKRLRPAALDEHGLIEAIPILLEEWGEQNPGIQCNLQINVSAGKLPEFVSIVAYRIVQEALTNIARHAKAHNVNVLINTMGANGSACLLVEIQDDGIGFDTSSSHHTSFGLTGMRERVESTNGSFKLASSHGTGVLISARLPLQQREKQD
ncbi:MAG: histidine kinase [Nitrosomonadales bacterium]|nr:histidine kinase [Nitrosomonadales bacterium]